MMLKTISAAALLAMSFVSTGCGPAASAGPAGGGGQIASVPNGQVPSFGGGGGDQSLPPLIQPPVSLDAGTGGSGPVLGADDSNLASGPAAPVTSGAMPAGGRSAFEVEVDNCMLALLNAERKKVGAQPLKFDPRLHRAAFSHALDMFTQGYIDHQNKQGLWGHDRAARAGFPVQGGLQNCNENVADVFARNSPAELAKICMWEYSQSDGHWKNLLDPKWNVCGLATIYRPATAKRDQYGETKNPNCQLFGKL